MPAFSTCYAPTYTLDTMTDLYVNSGTTQTMALFAQVANRGTSACTVEIWITDSGNVQKASYLASTSVAADAILVSSDRHVIPAGYKIRFKCSAADMLLEVSLLTMLDGDADGPREGNLPVATIAQKGITEYATALETSLGTVSDKAVTPLGLVPALSGSVAQAVTHTLWHTTDATGTISASYETLYQDGMIFHKSWYRTDVTFRVRWTQTGTGGRIRLTLTDGTNSAVAVTDALTATSGTAVLTADCTGLTDNSLWTFSLDALAGTDGELTVTRIKASAPPVDMLTPRKVLCDTGGSTNLTSYVQLGSGSLNPSDGDAAANVIFEAKVTIDSGVTSAELQFNLSGTHNNVTAVESVLVPVTASGLFRTDVSYPNSPDSFPAATVFGRILSGSGMLYLDYWQVSIEQ